MKAMIIRSFGAPGVFEAAELPDPTPQPGQLLIRVQASSVNPVDTKIRKNGPVFAPPLPAVLHGDVAGVVERLGEGVQGFSVGDEVYACAGGVRPLMGGQTSDTALDGALAELMRADAQLVARKPAGLSWAEAAALPLVGITAWEGLIDRAQVKAGERVLVIGGTGGVGHVAVQLAAALGAEVTAVVSGDRAGLARELGAAHTIDRKTQDVLDEARRLTGGSGYDVVYDTVGSEALTQALSAAGNNGRVVSTSTRGPQDLTPMHEHGLSLHVVYMLIPMLYGAGRAHQGTILRDLGAMVQAGTLRPVLDGDPLPFSQVAEAHLRVENGGGAGKVTLQGW